MHTVLLTLSLTALTPGGAPAGKYADRERHPFAPSLPLLTEKEQQALERVIDRFIEYDTGRLKGPAGAKALAAFKALGPEAIPALLDGLNRAANLEDSCPAVLIAKRLAQLLRASEDPKLLDFAREMIGAGVTARRHTVVLKDLKITCMVRKAALQRAGMGGKGSGSGSPAKGSKAGKAPRSMTVAELASAAGSERGPRLRQILNELEKRKGPKVLEGLGTAAAGSDKEVKELARGLLDKHLGRQTAAAVKAQLKHDRPEVRAAAARAVGKRGLRYGAELIGLLTDQEAEVSQASRQALVRLSRGQDYGPEPAADAQDVSAAVERWREWWAGQGKR
jgi:hypothetical protein